MEKIKQHIVYKEKLIFEKSKEGKKGVQFTDPLPEQKLPDNLRNNFGNLPSLSENEVVRHFVRLSNVNFSVDTGFYPLGSCTMKYNPKINEKIASFDSFVNAHPYLDNKFVQGNLELMYLIQEALAEITGLPGVTLTPSAGAHGEFTGMKIIKAYHDDNNTGRDTVLIPDTAHGTNPASAKMAGFKVKSIKVSEKGFLELDDIKDKIDEHTAALMVTNPNTIGIFEEELVKISNFLHDNGALLYGDGANLNALLGIAKASELGIDVMHINLHKTFSTPHGGGGPGAGPVVVRKDLEKYLPTPVVKKKSDKYYLDFDYPKSIGKVKEFYGHFGVIVKALAYIYSLGGKGLKRVSEIAVLNANYIREQLKDYYDLPFETNSMHEVVFTDKKQLKNGITTMDIAKALIDRGFHPPTIYFPLVVKDAIMIEPTETESKESMDDFIKAMIEIAETSENNPESLHQSPEKTIVNRLDEVKAARHPVLKFRSSSDQDN